MLILSHKNWQKVAQSIRIFNLSLKCRFSGQYDLFERKVPSEYRKACYEAIVELAKRVKISFFHFLEKNSRNSFRWTASATTWSNTTRVTSCFRAFSGLSFLIFLKIAKFTEFCLLNAVFKQCFKCFFFDPRTVIFGSRLLYFRCDSNLPEEERLSVALAKGVPSSQLGGWISCNKVKFYLNW